MILFVEAESGMNEWVWKKQGLLTNQLHQVGESVMCVRQSRIQTAVWVEVKQQSLLYIHAGKIEDDQSSDLTRYIIL